MTAQSITAPNVTHRPAVVGQQVVVIALGLADDRTWAIAVEVPTVIGLDARARRARPGDLLRPMQRPAGITQVTRVHGAGRVVEVDGTEVTIDLGDYAEIAEAMEVSRKAAAAAREASGVSALRGRRLPPA